ncbi:MAG: aminotransferase class III-fold pyridoxal phosphate-dependent enzyme [Planctomycetes bacterium]|nr:aminotransferase class III-fold pyridoxal phosphate-dependent enzyme [Planctomycetota bacterium]
MPMKSKSFDRLSSLLGDEGERIWAALQAARVYLEQTDERDLLRHIGKTIESIPSAKHLDKRLIQASYVKGPAEAPDDLLTGQGLFYLTEQRRLFLDCTAGHYQMTWGYNSPELTRVARLAMEAGIVWDDHSDIPGNPIKCLAAQLVRVAGPHGGGPANPAEDDGALNTVNLGVCTGSSAASTALKIILKYFEATRPGAGPVIVTMNGNYHGMDFLAQRLRGMWEKYFCSVHVVGIEPNDTAALRRAFHEHEGRVAAFFAEPILMNREAILLEKGFLQEARTLCDEADAAMVIDEIQTGFWRPEVFMFHQFDIVPDMLIVGKGMTSGFHPLAALLFKRKYDCLEQYDAINTNGNAPLAAMVALGCLSLVEQNGNRLADLSRYYEDRLREIPQEHPNRVAAIHGKGLLAGVKFRTVADALSFHRRCLERGLWVRVHAYHEGHSTVLTKLGLLADREVVDVVVNTFLDILREVGDE